MAALTITDGSQILLSYSRKFAAEIAQKMRAGLESEANTRSVYCDNTYVSPNATVTDVTQPYQPGWTAKGVVNMDDVSYTLKKGKFDLLFDADDLERWWNSYTPNWDESALGRPRDEWEIPRFVYDKFIIPKITEEMELSQAFHGVYAAPTTGTAGAAAAVVDGWKTVIAAQIVSGKIPSGNVITTGAITSTNVVTKLDTIVDGLPDVYRGKPGKVFVSHTLYNWYLRKYRDNGNGVAMQPSGVNALNTRAIIDGTMLSLVPLKSMVGSGRVIVDFNDNLIVGKRTGRPDVPVPVWQPDTRTLKCFGEYYRFYGVDRPFDLFVNDQV